MMIEIDGSYGEGGGQIIRTALALSVFTGQPFKVFNIRKGRKNPGLKQQHLTGVLAFRQLGGAKVDGATLGSDTLLFVPGNFTPKNIELDIGTAGSITLLFQSLLLPALFAKRKTTFEIKGGTDVEWSPSIDYFKEIIIPQMYRFADCSLSVKRRGFFPKGGGYVSLTINPRHKYASYLDLMDALRLSKIQFNLAKQGQIIHIRGVSYASKHLEISQVAEKQARSAKLILSRLKAPCNIRSEYCDTLSPGSGITLWTIYSQNDSELDLFNPIRIGSEALGKLGLKSELVGEKAANALIKEIESGCAVDSHLADNLIPYLAICGGSLRTSHVSEHTKTNIAIVEKFLGTKFSIQGKVISLSNIVHR